MSISLKIKCNENKIWEILAKNRYTYTYSKTLFQLKIHNYTKLNRDMKKILRWFSKFTIVIVQRLVSNLWRLKLVKNWTINQFDLRFPSSRLKTKRELKKPTFKEDCLQFGEQSPNDCGWIHTNINKNSTKLEIGPLFQFFRKIGSYFRNRGGKSKIHYFRRSLY